MELNFYIFLLNYKKCNTLSCCIPYIKFYCSFWQFNSLRNKRSLNKKISIPPNVGGLSWKYSPLTNFSTRQDFPTPESPNRTSLKLQTGWAIFVYSNSWCLYSFTYIALLESRKKWLKSFKFVLKIFTEIQFFK